MYHNFFSCLSHCSRNARLCSVWLWMLIDAGQIHISALIYISSWVQVMFEVAYLLLYNLNFLLILGFAASSSMAVIY